MHHSGGKLVPVNTVDLTGKTISNVFFANIENGDKMFVLFTDKTVLVMPVYRKCPVQVGMLTEFMQDRDLVINQCKNEMLAFCTERQKIIDFLTQDIADGMDSS